MSHLPFPIIPDVVVWHPDWREHHLIGCGLYPRTRLPHQMSQSEAYLTLQDEFTQGLPDFSAVWNWEAADVRRFFSALVAAGLLEPRFADAAISTIGGGQ